MPSEICWRINKVLFRELLQAAVSGETSALELLYHMYQPLITKMSLLNGKFDEDLYQEQMICFWKCLKKFMDNI